MIADQDREQITWLIKRRAEGLPTEELFILIAETKDVLNACRQLIEETGGHPRNIPQWLTASCHAAHINTQEFFNEINEAVALFTPAHNSGTDHHFLLGLEPNASREAIKQRYRELCRRYHPDATGQATGGRDTDTFIAITNAYQALMHSADNIGGPVAQPPPQQHWRRPLPRKKRALKQRNMLWFGLLAVALVVTSLLIAKAYNTKMMMTSLKNKGTAFVPPAKELAPPGNSIKQSTISLQGHGPVRVLDDIDKPERSAATEQTATRTQPVISTPQPDRQLVFPAESPPSSPAEQVPGQTVLTDVVKTVTPETNGPPEPPATGHALPPPQPTAREHAKAPAQTQTQEKKRPSMVEVERERHLTVVTDDSQGPVRRPSVHTATPAAAAAPTIAQETEPKVVVAPSSPHPPPAPREPIKTNAVSLSLPTEPEQIATAAQTQMPSTEPAPSVEISTEEQTHRKIKAFLSQYSTAYHQKNLAAFLPVFTLDATENGKSLQDVLPVYAQLFANTKTLHLHVDPLHWQQHNATIDLHGRFTIDLTYLNGTSVQGQGDINYLLIEEGEGLLIQSLDYVFDQ